MLEQYGVELIGAEAGRDQESRRPLRFKDAMKKIGLDLPTSQLVTDVESGLSSPRASGTGDPAAEPHDGGLGGGIAYNREDLVRYWNTSGLIFRRHEVLIEESWAGKNSSWK